MTEAEWLECADPWRMLEFLQQSYTRLSQRKLLLFAVVCCRNLLRSDEPAPVRLGIDQLELFADGAAELEDLNTARRAIYELDLDEFGHDFVFGAVNHATNSDYLRPLELAVGTLHYSAAAANLGAGNGSRAAEVTAHCRWLRDIFPAPFRPLLFKYEWKRTNNFTAPILAQAIYDERAFDRLPILADALEDAGCDHVDILNHCRQPGEHVRGCWPVDLLLGKS